jgi:type 1 glutamine amidotransferase
MALWFSLLSILETTRLPKRRAEYPIIAQVLWPIFSRKAQQSALVRNPSKPVLFDAHLLAPVLSLAVHYAGFYMLSFGEQGSNPGAPGMTKMNPITTRRDFLRTTAAAGAGLLLSRSAGAAKNKSVLLFTKSSGFEHAVIKVTDGKPSIVENAVREMAAKYNFDLTASKDGRIFDSKEFHDYAAVIFFTTGVLTEEGTDKNPPMTPQGKQAFLDAVDNGLGFVGIHAATDTFHTPPDQEDLSNRYIAHGEKSDPYIRMIGGEFIIHGQSKDPRLQTTNLTVDDPKFPGLEGVHSPVSMMDEWYSMKDFAPDLHVICTLDTSTMNGNAYKRPPYPVVWARMHGRGRVFYTAIGDRSENWQNPFHLNLLAGGIRWAIGDAKASVPPNLKTAAPGYAEIPPKYPPPAK